MSGHSPKHKLATQLYHHRQYKVYTIYATMKPMHINSEWKVYNVLLALLYFVVSYGVKKCCMVHKTHCLLSLVRKSSIHPCNRPNSQSLTRSPYSICIVRNELLTATNFDHWTLSARVGPKCTALFGPKFVTVVLNITANDKNSI